ncbi:hypothetical protein, partial [Vibrio parahaemolyticus]|uniref:hypothetical protein n=1 Tax=Vibrio parahaemolyticus TaxID=670 RepID=UPI0021535DC4
NLTCCFKRNKCMTYIEIDYFSSYHVGKQEAEYRQVINMKNIRNVRMYADLYMSERVYEVAPATFRSERSKVRKNK